MACSKQARSVHASLRAASMESEKARMLFEGTNALSPTRHADGRRDVTCYCPARIERRAKASGSVAAPSRGGSVTQHVVLTPVRLYDFGRTGAEDMGALDYPPLPMRYSLRAAVTAV
jgi:hypothetical protein